MTTSQLHPHGFLTPDTLPMLDPQHHAAVNDTNEKLSRIVDALVPKTEKLHASVELTSRGKHERLRSLGEQAERERSALIKQKHAAVDSWLSDASRVIEDALAPANPERVAEAREDVRLLVAASPPGSFPAQLMTDADGHMLPGQGGVADALLGAVSQGDLEAGKLTLGAVRHASPVLRHLIGGPEVIDGMARQLASRVAPAALARTASLEALKLVIESNGAHAHARILKLTDQGELRTDDPVREAATA